MPAALALWAINLIDRLFINGYKGQAEVGIYSLAVRIASVIVFLMTAFQLAWPAFAYSIRDDSAAKRTYAYVLTYLLFITCWMSLALGSLAPWLVEPARAARQLRAIGRAPCRSSPSASPRTRATRCLRSASAVPVRHS